MKILKWLLRIIPAFILLQTLYFKFTAAPESVYIFQTLGAEPFGRIASGIMELIAAIMLLIPKSTRWGSLLSMAIMFGAIASHVLFLGIEVMDDKGLLFIMANIVMLCAFFNFRLSRP